MGGFVILVDLLRGVSTGSLSSSLSLSLLSMMGEDLGLSSSFSRNIASLLITSSLVAGL